MKPMTRLTSYLTALMLAAGNTLALLVLSPAVLWAAPTTSSIQLDFFPWTVAIDSANNLIYAVDQENHQIRVIDGATGLQLPNTISFPVDSQLNVSYIAVDGERHRLFVDYYCSGCSTYMQVFDTETQQQVSRVEGAYGAGGMAINPDNGRVYVAMFHQVWVLYPDGAGGYWLGKTIDNLDDKAADVAYDRLHQRLYVSIHTNNEVAVVDTNTETLINYVPVLKGNPTSVAVNPNNRHVYVGQNLGNQISVVDGATDTALSNIKLNDGPVAVDVDPTTARVFVGMREAASVGIIDGNTDTLLSPLVPFNHTLTSLTVNTTDHCAYVGLRDQNSIFKVCDGIQGPVAAAGDNRTIKGWQQCGTVIEGVATSPDNYSLTYRWLEGQTVLLGSMPVGANGAAYLDLCNVPLALGTHTLTLEVSDANVTATDEMILTIGNSAPVAAPTGGGTYQISAPITVGGQVSDFDNDPLTYGWYEGTTPYCTGSVQAPANGVPGTIVTLADCALPFLTLGIHTLTLKVSDGINQPVSSNITVKVIDTTAPTLSPDPDQSILWPPNHKMVNITIKANASDDSGPPTFSAVVSSNEPQNGLADGDSAPDWTIPEINQETGEITLQLRAERSGSGDGRVYTVTITAADSQGNQSTALVNILVPHD